MRLLDAGHLPTAAALAWDEALARSSPTEPTLVLWRTYPAVVMGRFQRADWEVDAAACAARGVRVWRRFTGGGAVYLDGGTACAALVLPPDDDRARLRIPELYAPLLEGIVRALGMLGVAAERDERTVRVGGRKVTGVAAHVGRAGVIVHGTVLVSADLAALDDCLAGPRGGDLGGRPRPAPSRPDRVANVGEGGVEVTLAAAFGAAPSAPSAEEEALARRLAAERYADRAWHAGPWAEITPPAVLALLGPAPGSQPYEMNSSRLPSGSRK